MSSKMTIFSFPLITIVQVVYSCLFIKKINWLYKYFVLVYRKKKFYTIDLWIVYPLAILFILMLKCICFLSSFSWRMNRFYNKSVLRFKSIEGSNSIIMNHDNKYDWCCCFYVSHCKLWGPMSYISLIKIETNIILLYMGLAEFTKNGLDILMSLLINVWGNII